MGFINAPVLTVISWLCDEVKTREFESELLESKLPLFLYLGPLERSECPGLLIDLPHRQHWVELSCH